MRAFSAFVALAFVLASAGIASAETVSLTWGGPGSNDYTGTMYSNTGGPNGASNLIGNWSETVYLPTYNVSISGASDSSLNGPQSVYCVDLVSGVGTDGSYNLTQMGASAVTLTLGRVASAGGGTVPYTLADDRLRAVEYLLDKDYTAASGDASAALSLALWQTIYSPDASSSDLPSATISTNSVAVGFDVGNDLTNHDSVISAANSLLHTAYGAALTFAIPSTDKVYLLTDTNYQDFTFAVLGSQSASTPEPAGLVSLASMCMIGLPIGAVAYRRRRQVSAR